MVLGGSPGGAAGGRPGPPGGGGSGRRLGGLEGARRVAELWALCGGGVDRRGGARLPGEGGGQLGDRGASGEEEVVELLLLLLLLALLLFLILILILLLLDVVAQHRGGRVEVGAVVGQLEAQELVVGGLGGPGEPRAGLLDEVDGAVGAGDLGVLDEVLVVEGLAEVPREGLAAVDAGLDLDEGVGGVEGDPAGQRLVGLAHAHLHGLGARVGHEVQRLRQGDERHGVRAAAHRAALAEEVDLLGGGAADGDLLDLHAAVHVERLPLQQRRDLHAHQVLLVLQRHHGEQVPEQPAPAVLWGVRLQRFRRLHRRQVMTRGGRNMMIRRRRNMMIRRRRNMMIR